MWITLYRRLLQLYPAAYRDEFGREMLTVALQAEQDARNKSKTAQMSFHAREILGLLGGASREHAFVCNQKPGRWVSLLEAPVIGVLVYSFGILLLPRLGIHGLFSPASWIVAAILIAVCSWKLGKRRSDLWSTLTVVLLVAPSCLLALAASEHGWSTLVAQQHPTMSYSLPGMEVAIGATDTTPPIPSGVRFSAATILSDGTVMSIKGSSRAYRVSGGVLVALLALWSRRKSLRLDSRGQGGTL